MKTKLIKMSPASLSKNKKKKKNKIFITFLVGDNIRNKDFICVGRLSMKFYQDFPKFNGCLYLW